jgi:hypothetical protein
MGREQARVQKFSTGGGQIRDEQIFATFFGNLFFHATEKIYTEVEFLLSHIFFASSRCHIVGTTFSAVGLHFLCGPPPPLAAKTSYGGAHHLHPWLRLCMPGGHSNQRGAQASAGGGLGPRPPGSAPGGEGT